MTPIPSLPKIWRLSRDRDSSGGAHSSSETLASWNGQAWRLLVCGRRVVLNSICVPRLWRDSRRIVTTHTHGVVQVRVPPTRGRAIW